MLEGARTQAERRAETQARLREVGRAAFVAKGFAGVGEPEIVRAAGVTRGALQHHFGGKQGLFEAVVEAEADAVAAAVAAVPGGADALEQGAEVWFAAMAQPGRVRLLLIEAPAVLGAEAVAAIDATRGAAALQAGLTEAVGGDPALVRAAALLLSAAYDRAALAIAAGEAPGPWRKGLGRMTAAMVRELRRV